MECLNIYRLPKTVHGISEIVPYGQKLGFDCLGATIYALFLTLKKKIEYWELCTELGTTEDGVVNLSAPGLVLRRHGIPYVETFNAGIGDLTKFVRGNHYCVIEYQAPNSDYDPKILRSGNRKWVGRCTKHGHYSGIFGVEENGAEGEFFYIMDPLILPGETPQGIGVRRVDRELLLKRWILPPTSYEWVLAVPV